ncbi:MAG: hypothetical protein IPK79_01395 [Vampirovibrionales bacterium]|nr:hypothetical protein [Vampirovibrionales bacterium]
MSLLPSGSSLLIQVLFQALRKLLSPPSLPEINLHVEINLDGVRQVTDRSTENDLEDLDEASAADMKQLLLDLLHMDRLARNQGHTLVEVLVKAARDQLGIDIRPAHDRGAVTRRDYNQD